MRSSAWLGRKGSLREPPGNIRGGGYPSPRVSSLASAASIRRERERLVRSSPCRGSILSGGRAVHFSTSAISILTSSNARPMRIPPSLSRRRRPDPVIMKRNVGSFRMHRSVGIWRQPRGLRSLPTARPPEDYSRRLVNREVSTRRNLEGGAPPLRRREQLQRRRRPRNGRQPTRWLAVTFIAIVSMAIDLLAHTAIASPQCFPATAALLIDRRSSGDQRRSCTRRGGCEQRAAQYPQRSAERASGAGANR
jgi:hypothetical protein